MAETNPETVVDTEAATDEPTELSDDQRAELAGILGDDEPGEAPAGDEAAAEAETETAVAADGDDAEAAAAAEEAAAATAAAEAEKLKPVAPPATQPAAQPTAEQQAQIEAQQAYQQRVTKYNTDLAAYKAKLAAPNARDNFDPVDDSLEAARLQIEAADLLNVRIAMVEAVAAQQQQRSQVDTEWHRWGQQHADIGVRKGQDIFEQEFTKAQAKYPGASAETLRVLATEGLNRSVTLMRAHAAKKAKEVGSAARAPARPPAPGAGRVTPVIPAASAQRPPAPQPKTLEDKIDAFARSAGSPDLLDDE